MNLSTTLPLVLALSLSAFAEPYEIASESLIEERVKSAEAALSKTEGGALIWESIQAHGGLDTWFANGLLEFRWTYNMLDRGLVKDTTQVIDTWSSKARHTGHGDMNGVTFGWDGKASWIEPKDANIGIPPAFWGLTPYYFVGVPHVLADPGTIHELLPEKISFKGTEYNQVKVTYESGTGESPDDYYIVLIEPESKRVKGVRYIVTSSLLGLTGAPVEKLLTYEGWSELDGVLFPKNHETYTMNGNTVGELLRTADVSSADFIGTGEIDFGKF